MFGHGRELYVKESSRVARVKFSGTRDVLDHVVAILVVPQAADIMLPHR